MLSSWGTPHQMTPPTPCCKHSEKGLKTLSATGVPPSACTWRSLTTPWTGLSPTAAMASTSTQSLTIVLGCENQSLAGSNAGVEPHSTNVAQRAEQNYASPSPELPPVPHHNPLNPRRHHEHPYPHRHHRRSRHVPSRSARLPATTL